MLEKIKLLRKKANIRKFIQITWLLLQYLPACLTQEYSLMQEPWWRIHAELCGNRFPDPVSGPRRNTSYRDAVRVNLGYISAPYQVYSYFHSIWTVSTLKFQVVKWSIYFSQVKEKLGCVHQFSMCYCMEYAFNIQSLLQSVSGQFPHTVNSYISEYQIMICQN